MVFHVFPSRAPVPQREDKKTVRGYYARSVLTDAIRAVMQDRMTMAESAEFHKIPRTTLQKRVAKIRKEHLKLVQHKRVMRSQEQGGAEEAGTSKEPEREKQATVPQPYESQNPIECTSTQLLPSDAFIVKEEVEIGVGPQPPKKVIYLNREQMQEAVRELNNHLPKSQHISYNIGQLLYNDGYGRVVKEYVLRDSVEHPDEDDELVAVEENRLDQSEIDIDVANL